MAATKKLSRTSRMPRACPVEAHVCCYRESVNCSLKAISVKLHGASPWHLSVMQLAFGSNQRENSTGQARGIKASFDTVS